MKCCLQVGHRTGAGFVDDGVTGEGATESDDGRRDVDGDGLLSVEVIVEVTLPLLVSMVATFCPDEVMDGAMTDVGRFLGTKRFADRVLE